MKIRCFVEGLRCPACNDLLAVTHRYEPVRRIACGTTGCKNFGVEYEQPHNDFDLKPILPRHKTEAGT